MQLRHRFGDDAHFSDHAHEIHVAGPAGNDVLMQVAGESGAGAAAEVDPDVEALSADGSLEQRHRVGGLLGQIELLLSRERFQLELVGGGATSRWPLV